jgi:hypothetical protein
MSKMTVTLEKGDEAHKYQTMHLSEFCEMISRVAVIKFVGSELEKLPLHKKIEYVIDSIFKPFKLKRSDVKSTESPENIASDSDY